MKRRTEKKQATRYLEERARERRWERNSHRRIYVIALMREIVRRGFCEHGRPHGVPCPWCLGINQAAIARDGGDTRWDGAYDAEGT